MPQYQNKREDVVVQPGIIYLTLGIGFLLICPVFITIAVLCREPDLGYISFIFIPAGLGSLFYYGRKRIVFEADSVEIRRVLAPKRSYSYGSISLVSVNTKKQGGPVKLFAAGKKIAEYVLADKNYFEALALLKLRGVTVVEQTGCGLDYPLPAPIALEAADEFCANAMREMQIRLREEHKADAQALGRDVTFECELWKQDDPYGGMCMIYIKKNGRYACVKSRGKKLDWAMFPVFLVGPLSRKHGQFVPGQYIRNVNYEQALSGEMWRFAIKRTREKGLEERSEKPDIAPPWRCEKF